MAREFLSRLRRYRRVAAAVALGLAAMLAASRLIPMNDTPVLVTARDVSAGTALTGRDFRVTHYPKSLVPAGSLAQSDEATGAIPLTDLTRGTPLTTSMLRGSGTVPTRASHVALPLRVADSSAVSLLHPGDHIMVFARSPDGGRADVAADDVVVLRISTPQGADTASSEASGTSLITVDVDKVTARKLAGTESAHKFALLGG